MSVYVEHVRACLYTKTQSKGRFEEILSCLQPCKCQVLSKELHQGHEGGSASRLNETQTRAALDDLTGTHSWQVCPSSAVSRAGKLLSIAFPSLSNREATVASWVAQWLEELMQLKL